MSIDLKTYFESIERDDYQRENFDDFLKKVNFQYHVPSIHIAGSNGKGSTANYLANVYIAQAHNVGLFTSPALNRVNEMITINGQEISDEEFSKMIQENEKLFNKYSISPFEIQTFIALSYFEKHHCDIAIVECGMGGEIDATNIFTPIASVITSISLEHTAFLGRSLCEIAYQKAGIIKDEVPVVTGILEEEASNTILTVAKEKNCSLRTSVEPANVVYNDNSISFNYLTYKNLLIKSVADYSLKDACIAIEVINCLMDQFPVSEENIQLGLANTYMPVRMEIVKDNPLIIVDGSHNPEGVSCMTKSLITAAKDKPIHILFACFKDKNIERMIAYLGEYSHDITLTTFPNKRSRTEEDYYLYLGDYPFKEDCLSALQELEALYPEDAILITGSLAFAAYMKNFIK